MSFSPPLHIATHTASTSSGNSSNQSYSPVYLRHQEDLINAYEAEEERIINVLSRKLEQLKEDNIQLENIREAESESHVNRLSRELSALRIAHYQLQQQQQQNQQSSQSQSPQEPSSPCLRNNNPNLTSTGIISSSMSPDSRRGFKSLVSSGRWTDSGEPSAEMMLEAMRRENEHLRNKLVDAERDYVRISRLNEIYREELIHHRRKSGLPVDNLIGLSSSDPFSQPTHRRSSSTSSSGQAYFSNTSSPSPSAFHIPSSSYVPRHALPHNHSQTSNPSHTHIGVPIPRPPSQIHRPKNNFSSESNTPLSHSPSSASAESSPLYPFSPAPSSSSSPPSYVNPTSFLSVSTNLTTPPSSASFNSTALGMGMGYTPASRELSYPSVPPPSLSSSFGSPTVSLLQIPGQDASLSPTEPLSRRNSNAGVNPGSGISGSGIARRGSLDRRIVESGNLRSGSGSSGGGSHSRRGSFDRAIPIGGRLAETGTLLGRGGRSRAGSQTHGHGVSGGGGSGLLPETVDEVEDSSLPLPMTGLGEVSTTVKGRGRGMLDPDTKSR